MQRLNPSVSGALRSFAFWLANRSAGGDVLRDVDYSCIFNEPSALEQVFAIFANVITLDDEGRVLNAKWAERRAAHYIRQYVTGIPADPILQPWECTLHPPPPKTDLPDLTIHRNKSPFASFSEDKKDSSQKPPRPPMHDFDLFVIGGGSGGVRCARIAASHGAKVAIAEDRHWGGTCVNIGCVPKKLMVQAAEYGTFARDAVGFGWSESAPVHDWATLIDRKDDEIARLNGVYVRLLESAGVTMFNARASFIDAQTLLVGEQRVTAKNIVIAVGGAPVRAAIEGAELGVVSDDVFHLRTMPRRVAIIGAGYIAVEFAGIFAGLGAEVDLVFRGDLPLRGFDHDLRTALAEALVAQGVRVHAGAQPRRVDAVHGGQRRLELADGRTIDTDLVFFATGRAPLTAGLGLEQAGIATTPAGEIVTDALHATSAAGVYAIGDCTDALNLTPVAIAQGHRLADRLFSPGFQRDWAFAPVPTAVFSSPPIATCGLTEAEAAARGPADIYLARFTPMRHVLSGRNRKTLMKLVVDQASQRVVGAHMIGEDAGEMMQAIGIAMVAGATKADFDRTIGIHPTSAEEWVTLRTRTRVAGG